MFYTLAIGCSELNNECFSCLRSLFVCVYGLTRVQCIHLEEYMAWGDAEMFI